MTWVSKLKKVCVIRKEKTQWHNVVGFVNGFAQLTDRLVKGAHVFVQGQADDA